MLSLWAIAPGVYLVKSGVGSRARDFDIASCVRSSWSLVLAVDFRPPSLPTQLGMNLIREDNIKALCLLPSVFSTFDLHDYEFEQFEQKKRPRAFWQGLVLRNNQLISVCSSDVYDRMCVTFKVMYIFFFD